MLTRDAQYSKLRRKQQVRTTIGNEHGFELRYKISGENDYWQRASLKDKIKKQVKAMTTDNEDKFKLRYKITGSLLPAVAHLYSMCRVGRFG